LWLWLKDAALGAGKSGERNKKQPNKAMNRWMILRLSNQMLDWMYLPGYVKMCANCQRARKSGANRWTGANLCTHTQQFAQKPADEAVLKKDLLPRKITIKYQVCVRKKNREKGVVAQTALLQFECIFIHIVYPNELGCQGEIYIPFVIDLGDFLSCMCWFYYLAGIR